MSSSRFTPGYQNITAFVTAEANRPRNIAIQQRLHIYSGGMFAHASSILYRFYSWHIPPHQYNWKFITFSSPVYDGHTCNGCTQWLNTAVKHNGNTQRLHTTVTYHYNRGGVIVCTSPVPLRSHLRACSAAFGWPELIARKRALSAFGNAAPSSPPASCPASRQ